MFVRIGNTPRDYAWGSKTAIAGLLGNPASGKPEAELWLGAHAGSPSRILDPSQADGASDLAEWIERDPLAALGADGPSASSDAPRLPFLLKVLAADGALSLQAHPSPEQAREGFERENAAGVPLDAPERNYKDPFHKPEMIYALSETFDALCGFRGVSDAVKDVDRMIEAAGEDATVRLRDLRSRLARTADEEIALRETVAWLLGGDPVITALIDEVVAASTAVADSGELRVFATVTRLSDEYPGDPGIVLSILLNRVTLRRGEALYLPSGNIHAYLNGLGVELMAASDNVLRGGLTPKHIDVPELLSVLDFSPVPVPFLPPTESAPGVEVYRPEPPVFELTRISRTQGGSHIRIEGPAIALCVDGESELVGTSGRCILRKGEAVYITPDEAEIIFDGGAEVFLATSPQ